METDFKRFVLDKSKYLDYFSSERIYHSTRKTLSLNYDWWVVNSETGEKIVVSYKYLLDVDLWEARMEFYKKHRTIGCAIRTDSVVEAEKKTKKVIEKKIVSFEKLGGGTNVVEEKRIPTVSKEDLKIIEEKIKKEEQLEMVRKIVETGAKLDIQEDQSQFMSVEDSVSFYKQYKTKTNYAYYKQRETGDVIIATDMYKDDRFSMEDINYLSTIYQGIGIAIRSDVAVPLAMDTSNRGVKKEKVKKDEKPKKEELPLSNIKNGETKSDVVSQASKKLKQYNIVENEEFLPMQISKRLWIVGETNSEFEWRIGDNDTMYVSESTKKSEDPMACLAHKKSEYPDLSNIPSMPEGALRHVVNAEIYDRRFGTDNK